MTRWLSDKKDNDKPKGASGRASARQANPVEIWQQENPWRQEYTTMRDLMDLDKAVSQPVTLDPSRTGKDAESLDSSLRRLVVGQPDAIDQIVNIYQMHLTGMNAPGRPVGSFLFLGPTGTGKTRIVEATAEALVGNPRAVIKIDCAEFQHSHEIAKLIGSPPDTWVTGRRTRC